MKHESSLSLRLQSVWAASTVARTRSGVFSMTNIGHDGHGDGPEGVVLWFPKTQNMEQDLFEFISVYLCVAKSVSSLSAVSSSAPG